MDTFITPSWVTKDVAMFWKNSIKFVGKFDRQWQKEWSAHATKLGDTIQVRIPQRFQTFEGQGIIIQSILNQTVPLSINHQWQTACEWSSADSALRVEEVQKRYTKPMAYSMTNKTDKTAAEETYKQIWNSIGAPGTPLSNNLTWTNGVALLRAMGVPEDLCAVTDTFTQAQITNANLALFGPRAVIDRYFRDSKYASNALGIDDWYYDPNMATHTTGTFTASTPAVNAGSQSGSTLATDGWGTYALVEGDVFTIDGVYGVNPVSYADQGQLQQFVLTSDVAGSTTATLSFQPPLIASGQLQTVVSLPADNAAINFLGATGAVGATMTATRSRQSMIFNPEAFALAMVSLPDDLPGARAKTITDPEARVSMRHVEQYQASTDQLPRRIDSLSGTGVILPGFALRAWS